MPTAGIQSLVVKIDLRELFARGLRASCETAQVMPLLSLRHVWKLTSLKLGECPNK